MRATINASGSSLAALPATSAVSFHGLHTWSPVSTTALTAALHLDRGLWATWRSRRLTPSPLPEAWFRPATGRPLVYRVDHILNWLASRRGEHPDTLHTWRLSLRTDFEADVSDPAEVRKLVQLYAEVTGPKVGDVSFTPAGFAAYLAALGEAS